MKRSTITQLAGLVIVIAGLAVESLDTKRVVMLCGVMFFWFGIGMKRGKKDDNGQ